jgi:hypothetical protein
MNRKAQFILGILAALASFAPSALACSVCFGDPNSAQSKALATAVLFLLGTVAAVLGAIFYSILVWAHRAKKLQQASQAAL